MEVNTPKHRQQSHTVFNLKVVEKQREYRKEINCKICGWTFKPRDAKQRRDKICPDHDIIQ